MYIKRTPEEILRATKAVELLRYVRAQKPYRLGGRRLSYWDLGHAVDASDNAVRCWILGKNLPSPANANQIFCAFKAHFQDMEAAKVRALPIKEHPAVTKEAPLKGKPCTPADLDRAIDEELHHTFLSGVTCILRLLPLRRVLAVKQAIQVVAEQQLVEHKAELLPRQTSG